MKLTNKEMKEMRSTLIEIGAKEGIDTVLGVKIARNNYELMKMVEPVEKAEESLIETHALRNDAGEMIRAANGGISLKDGRAYHAELKRLMEADGDVKLAEFTRKELKQMSPTPNQILTLLPILSDK